jgi:hypothetical protein
MQDLAISGTSDFKMFPGSPPIIVLEDVIMRGPIIKSNFALGPQISLGDPRYCAVHVGFGIFEYNCIACFVVTHYFKGVFRNFQGVLLLG